MHISTGSQVTVRINGSQKLFQIVEPHETNPAEGCISYDSPIANALIGKAQGTEAVAVLPNGNQIGIEILEIN